MVVQGGIRIKTPQQIEKMRCAGAVVWAVLDACEQACQPGVSTGELDRLAYDTFTQLGGEGLFKGYPDYEPGRGYPGHTCISINEEIVHGIPRDDRIIIDGDLVSIDCGVRVDGWCGDSARSILVGTVPTRTRDLVNATRNLLDLAIRHVRPGVKWGAIARLLEQEARRDRYGIVKEYVGHGIGRLMHEPPKVPNFVSNELMKADFELVPGMVLAIEPMLTLGTGETRALDDGWTVVTADGTPAAHIEHTVAVTFSGADVLTAGPPDDHEPHA
ncbi:MAG: type I methionyl aminopeptidase [Planctomycetes bacterium]|nr:type I methionyl aminopeptidase [Planctomycetota bacterium]NOG55503.1 type I methionyl aminopeptidase [Planctomycetota bacterium]